MIEVAVDSIRVHMPTGQHVVILKEKGADRYLPIWIGPFEANAIALKITGVAPDRPITHDLMATALSELGIGLQRIVVTSLADEVFYARLHLQQNGREIDVDARPSDAIALAVRAECPIFVADKVFEDAGVTPDKEEDEEGGGGLTGGAEIDEERLEIFKHLVNTELNLPDLPDEPEPGRGKPSSS